MPARLPAARSPSPWQSGGGVDGGARPRAPRIAVGGAILGLLADRCAGVAAGVRSSRFRASCPARQTP
eukprot:7603474-Lingulodinium_polyedra.AAC.1